MFETLKVGRYILHVSRFYFHKNLYTRGSRFSQTPVKSIENYKRVTFCFSTAKAST